MSFREIALLALLVDKYNSEKPNLLDPEWSNEFTSLMRRGYVDIQGDPTRLGKNQAYFCKQKRIIFNKEAKTRGIRYAISMVLGGLEGVLHYAGDEPELESRFNDTLNQFLAHRECQQSII